MCMCVCICDDVCVCLPLLGILGISVPVRGEGYCVLGQLMSSTRAINPCPLKGFFGGAADQVLASISKPQFKGSLPL